MRRRPRSSPRRRITAMSGLMTIRTLFPDGDDGSSATASIGGYQRTPSPSHRRRRLGGGRILRSRGLEVSGSSDRAGRFRGHPRCSRASSSSSSPRCPSGTMMGWTSIPTKTEVMGCNRHHSSSPYHFMVEDHDDNDGGAATPSSAADRYRRLLCVKGGGSSGHPAHTTWAGAFQDGRRELVEHFREHWEGHHGRRRE